MTPERREKLKKLCGQFLADSRLKPKTVKGQDAIFAFYAGALALDQELGHPADAYLTICMCSGRLEALVEMPA